MTKKTIIIQILITLISLSGCNIKPTTPSKQAEKPPEQTGGGSTADGSATTASVPLRSPAGPSAASKPIKATKTEAEKKALAKTCSEISDEATCNKNADCKFYIVCMPADKALEIENDKELKAKFEKAKNDAERQIYSDLSERILGRKLDGDEYPYQWKYLDLLKKEKINTIIGNSDSYTISSAKRKVLQDLRTKMGENNQKNREANEQREKVEREKQAKKKLEAEEQRKREEAEEEERERPAKEKREREQAERDLKNEQERQEWLESNRLKAEKEAREEQERTRLDLEKKQQEETERRQREEQERKQRLAQQQKQILEKKEKKEQERKKLEEIDREREKERERNRIAEEENKKQRAEQAKIDSIKRDNQYVMKESLKRRLDPFSLNILDALLEKSNNLVHRDELVSVIVEEIQKNLKYSSEYYTREEQKEIYQKNISLLKNGLQIILMQEIETDKWKNLKGGSVFISGIYNNIFQKNLFIDVVEILTLSDESLISYIKNKTNNTEKENLKSLTTEYGLKSEEKEQLKKVLTSAGIIN